ncbi:MAG: PAS domain S-box protein [Candidatus Omnitrophota bacterium]
MSTYQVLVADDDVSIRNLIQRLCLELNWTVDLAADGQEALKYLAERPHQIFVIDVKMPGPSGIDLARRILQIEEAPAILILTGHAEVDMAVQAIKEGVYDYIQKDVVEIDVFKRILARAADYREKRLWSMRAQREREKTILDMEAANRQFQSILELSSDLIFILDARSRQILDCNAEARRRLGFERQELLGLKFSAIDQDLAQAKWEESLRTALSEKPPLLEIVFYGKEGISFPVEVSFDYVCLDTGEFIAVVARDISERKKAETILQESENKYRTLFESSTDALMLLSSGGFIDCNKQTLEMFGLSNKEEFLHVHPADLSPPFQSDGEDSRMAANRKIAEAFERGFNKFEWIHRRKNGEDFSADVWLTAFQLGGERFLNATVRDITDLKKAEESLREREEVLSKITTSAQDAIIMIDHEGIIILWNPSAERIFGYSSQEAMGKELHTLLAPQSYYKDYQRGFASFQKTGEGAAVGKTLELTVIHKNGRLVPVELSLSAVSIKNQWNAIGILRDISQRKRHEDKILQARQLAETQAAMLRTIIETMDEGVVVSDERHGITEVNDFFVRLAQTPKEFLIGADLNRVIRDISGCSLAPILDRFRNSEEWYRTNLQGEIAGNKVLLSLQPIFHNGVFHGAILTIVDISEIVSDREKAEDDIRRNNEFFLNAHKEMHAPLDGLLEMADQALTGAIDGDQRLFLEMIKQCGITLKNILDDVKNRIEQEIPMS